MIEHILAAVTNLIINVISTLGYPGVGLLMAIQTIAIPMPSEVIIPFAGSLVVAGRFSLFGIALTGGLGSSLGAAVAYFIGYKGGRPLVEKYGKYVLISHHDLQIADNFFAKHGTKAAFLGMLLPVVRSFISFPAGISRVKFWKFELYVFLASFIWSAVLGYIGEKLGENWMSLRDKFKGFDYIIVALIVLGATWWVYRHIKNSKSVG
jgi:membrane protein DedA with SNARE-associated domain